MNYTKALAIRKKIADNLPTAAEMKTLTFDEIKIRCSQIYYASSELEREINVLIQASNNPPWVANTTQVLNANDGLMWTFVRFLANNQVLIKQDGEFDVANLPELTEVKP